MPTTTVDDDDWVDAQRDRDRTVAARAASAVPEGDDAAVCVVVVSYNGAPWLRDCLASIARSSRRADAIVVDNGSADDSVAIARGFGVTVIASPRNLGFGRANNIGIRMALERGARYVLLLNQDAVLETSTVANLVAESRRRPALGILCPMQYDEGGATLDPTFFGYYLARHAKTLVDDLLRGDVQPSYDVERAPAAGWLLTRECLMGIGGFDPLYFMYGEDDDLCDRAWHHGFRVAIVTSASFRHARGFHAVEVGRVRRFTKAVSRTRSGLIRDIKRPRRNLVRNAWVSVVSQLAGGIASGLAHLDPGAALASLLAVAGVCVELPRIASHRWRCESQGPHWLFDDRRVASRSAIDLPAAGSADFAT